MLIGRFLTILPALAIAGFLAAKKIVPPSSATFPTASPLFTALLIGVVLIVGALTFLPSLVLGPFIEHLLILSGRTF
jgi:K+-transporting ATPase ATPase A chain